MQRRQAIQEVVPDRFWTVLDRYDDGTWTSYTPGFAYEGTFNELCIWTSCLFVSCQNCAICQLIRRTRSHICFSISRPSLRSTFYLLRLFDGSVEPPHDSDICAPLCAVTTREDSQRGAFAQAERRLARIIRTMYEMGHRLPAASPNLAAAQQEERSNREVYELLEERLRDGTSGASPKVVEQQWLRVHVDLSLADSLDENPLTRSASLSTHIRARFS